MTLSTRRFEQTRPLKSGRQLTALRHLLLLTLLALGTAATPAGASRDPSAGWSAELKVATPIAPGMRPIDEFPGQLRLPNRDDATVQHLAVQSATYGLRPSPSGGTPFYQVVLGQTPEPGQPILARFFGAPGSTLFPSFGGGPIRPDDCAPTAPYCTDSLYGPGGPITTEMFYGLASTSADRAQAVHSFGPYGESWFVILYSPTTDATFGFTLHAERASQVGASSLSPANLRFAQRLVDQAAAFDVVMLHHSAPSASFADGR